MHRYTLLSENSMKSLHKIERSSTISIFKVERLKIGMNMPHSKVFDHITLYLRNYLIFCNIGTTLLNIGLGAKGLYFMKVGIVSPHGGKIKFEFLLFTKGQLS